MIKPLAVIAAVLSTCLALEVAVHANDYVPGVGGFVDKAQVAQAFHWDSVQLVQNANRVTFFYESVDRYAVSCSLDALACDKKPCNLMRQETLAVASMPAIEKLPDGSRDFTGFHLLGFRGEASIVGAAPVIGDLCPDDSRSGTVVRSKLIDVREILFVQFEGARRPLRLSAP